MRNSSSLDWLRFMHTPNDYRVSRLYWLALLRVKVKTRQNLICLVSGIRMKRLISGHIPGEEVRL